MSSLFCKLNIGAAVATAMLISMPVQAASDGTKSNAEVQQLVEVTTPEARYRLSRREAYAAYEEARNACRQTSSTERTACMRDAKKQLHDDLAYAKVQLQDNARVSSGTSGRSASSTSSSSTSTQQ